MVIAASERGAVLPPKGEELPDSADEASAPQPGDGGRRRIAYPPTLPPAAAHPRDELGVERARAKRMGVEDDVRADYRKRGAGTESDDRAFSPPRCQARAVRFRSLHGSAVQ